MKPALLLLMMFSFLALGVQTASAGRKSLLLLRNIQQSVGLTYNFDQYHYSSSSTSRHEAFEDYIVGTDYAIYDPNILNGRFTIGFRLKQDDYSSDDYDNTTAGYGIFYDIRGVLGEKNTYPLHFMLNSKTEDISRNYGVDYQLKTETYGASLIIRNFYLPGTVNLIRSISETDGLDADNKITRDELSLHLRNSYRISESYVDVSLVQEDYDESIPNPDEDFNDSAELDFGNVLNWKNRGLARQLNTTVKVWKANGLNERDDLEWNETLGWDLGRALRSGLNYTYTIARPDGVDRESNLWRGWLQHELYQSLTTQLEVFGRDTDFSPGDEQVVGGRIGWGYRKILPAESSLNAQLFTQYQVTDRNLESQTQTIINEPHPVVLGERLFLDNLNAVPESIVVRNRDPLVRVAPYEEGIDYRVEQVGARTEIVVEGAGLSNIILTGMVLLISYDIRVDPDIRFATDAEGIAAEVHLFADRYRVFASFDRIHQGILSGDDDANYLADQRNYRLGGERRWRTITLSSEYQRFESDIQSNQFIDGTLRYYDVLESGSLSLYLRDRYWWYDASGSNATDDQNLINLGGQYRTTLLGSVLTTLTGDYQRVMGGADSDRLALGADFRWAFRQLVVSLRSRAAFRWIEGELTRDEHVRLELTRYF